MTDTDISDVELATKIVGYLPAKYQKIMAGCLDSLKKTPNNADETWQFRKFMIMLYLALYPDQNEFWSLKDNTYKFWRNKGKERLYELQFKQGVSA